MPRFPLLKRIPVVPEDVQIRGSVEAEDFDDESLEDFIQTIASNQGFNAIMSVIDSLISTIERQEIMIWSLAKLLEEKGLITKEELLIKMNELNKRRHEGIHQEG